MRACGTYVLALVFLAGLLLAPGIQEASSQETTVRIGTFGGIPRLVDPFDQLGRLQADLENIYEPLVYPYRDTFEIRGVLAESWTASEGGAVWTFRLRRGVRFHDGTELTAEAVKLSFERDRQVGRSTGSGLLSDVREVRVVDSHTVQFVLRLAGGPPFLPRLTGLTIASAKALTERANDPAWFRSNAVGTGPYRLEEFVARDRLVLQRFDQYWGPKPFFARAIFLEIPEAATQALMIERGELDIAYLIPPRSLPAMKQNPQLRVIQVPGDRVMNWRMNVSTGPLTNRLVRKALAYAVDYEAIVRARPEEISMTEGPVPAKYLGGWVPPNLIMKRDLTRARQLLAEAGIRPGQLTVTLNYTVGASVQASAGEVLQANLRDIGVNARINSVDFTPMFLKLQRFARSKNPADAEDTMTLIRGPYIPHAHAYFGSYQVGDQWNFMGYENLRVSQLFELGYAVERRDPARAQEYYRQAVQLIVDDQPDLWLYTEKRIVVLRRNLEGYFLHPIWFPETHVFTLRRR